MTDTQTPPTPPLDEKPKSSWHAMFWQSLDVVKLLALMIAGSYIGMNVYHGDVDEALRNSFMLIVGFYFGSSTGSKAKDAPLISAAEKKAE